MRTRGQRARRFEASADLPRRGIAAHRGGAAHRPENTLAAFAEAVRLGVHQIELDVRRCATGEIVVIHDARVDRTTDGEGEVAALPLAALRALDAGRHHGEAFRGEQIPILDEVLESFPPTVWINVQIKYGEPIATAVVERILAHDRLHQTLLACGNAAGREARQRAPDVRLCALARKDSRGAYIRHAAAEGSDFVQFHHGRGEPNEQEIAAARAEGLRINHFCAPGSERSPGVLAALLRAGIDFPLVDDLEAALAVSDAEAIPRIQR